MVSPGIYLYHIGQTPTWKTLSPHSRGMLRHRAHSSSPPPPFYKTFVQSESDFSRKRLMEMFGNIQYEFQFEPQKLVVWSHDGLLFVFSVKISLAEHKRICKREGTQGRPRCWGGGSSRRGHWRRAWHGGAAAAHKHSSKGRGREDRQPGWVDEISLGAQKWLKYFAFSLISLHPAYCCKLPTLLESGPKSWQIRF